jgi:hypothetical protein
LTRINRRSLKAWEAALLQSPKGRDRTPMFQRMILHLARNWDFPEGSAERGYEINAPLDASGHLDAKAWKRHKASTVVRRFWAGEGDRVGQLERGDMDDRLRSGGA